MSKKWNAELQFPTNSDFVNRIIAGSFALSNSSKNPMVTLELEVNSPQEVEIGGEMVNIAGVKAKTYFVSKVINADGSINEEKTKACQDKIKELWTKMGLDPETINWDNIDYKPLLGKLVLTMMSSDEDEMRKNPTTAQIEEAKKKNKRAEGEILKNPITGKAIIRYWPQVREIFGLSPNQDGATVAY